MRLELAIVAVLVVGCNSGSRPPVVAVDSEGVWAPLRIELPAMQQGGRTSWPLLARNASKQSCKVVKFRSSCECASITPCPLAVEAGSDRHCALEIDMSGEGSFAGSLRIEVNGIDEAGTAIMRLTALVDVQGSNFEAARHAAR